MGKGKAKIISSKTKVYRIVDISVLMKMFKEKKNYLSCPKNWDDHWEKLDLKMKDPTKQAKFYRCRDKIFSQCWSIENYSWAMWKMNSKNGYGVRIKTSLGKIYNSLPRSIRSNYPIDDLIKGVTYLKEKEIKKIIRSVFNQKTFSQESVIELYFKKRRAFEFEKEVRLIVPFERASTGFEVKKIKEKKFIAHAFDPTTNIESIYFDTDVPLSVFEIFKTVLQDEYRFKKAIERSNINRKPRPIRV